jgi:hypothetical protein
MAASSARRAKVPAVAELEDHRGRTILASNAALIKPRE